MPTLTGAAAGAAQAAGLRAGGGDLGLWPAAIEVLKALGVTAAEVAAFGRAVARGELWSSRGHRLAAFDLQAVAGPAGGGEDFHVVHREGLHAALAARLDGAALLTDCEVEGFAQDAGGVDVAYRRGGRRRTLRGRALVGADGLGSAVRRALWAGEDAAAAARRAGEVCIRGTARVEAPLFDAERAGTFALVSGPGRRAAAGACSGDGRLVYWWVKEPGAGTGEDRARCKARLLAEYAAWPLGLCRAVAATPADRILIDELVDLEPFPEWTRGRVALMGDACHPTTPNMGQGACLALEDALVLATLLRRHLDRGGRYAVADALKAFQACRAEHAARVQALSWRQGRLGQIAHPALVFLKEFVLKRLPAAAHETKLRQNIFNFPEGMGAWVAEYREAAGRLPRYAQWKA